MRLGLLVDFFRKNTYNLLLTLAFLFYFMSKNGLNLDRISQRFAEARKPRTRVEKELLAIAALSSVVVHLLLITHDVSEKVDNVMITALEKDEEAKSETRVEIVINLGKKNVKKKQEKVDQASVDDLPFLNQIEQLGAIKSFIKEKFEEKGDEAINGIDLASVLFYSVRWMRA